MSKHPEIGDKFPIRDIGLESIAELPNRLRELQPKKIDELAASMKLNGLINPITVRPQKGTGYSLVAGRHRLHAAKRLKWSGIRCHVIGDLLDEDDAAALIEIDENLIRAELNVEEKRELLLKRKELWQKRLTESGTGSSEPEPRSGPQGGRPIGFAADTAKETGIPKSTTNRLLADPKRKPRPSVVKPAAAGGIEAARRHYLFEFAELDRSEWDGERDLLDDAIREIVGKALAANGRDNERKAEAV